MKLNDPDVDDREFELDDLIQIHVNEGKLNEFNMILDKIENQEIKISSYIIEIIVILYYF